MTFTITKLFVAALAAGAAQALPQTQMNSEREVPTSTVAPSPSAVPVDNTPLIEQLELAPTAIDRFKKLLVGADGKLLQGDELQKKVVFDFNNPAPAPGAKGGALSAANIKTFPILTELGISTTVGFLEACGLNTPHTHPRATEFLTVVEGELDFGFILENGLVAADKGSSEVTGNLKKFQGAAFPVGSIHYQVNPTCFPTTFVATLNSEDPGTSQVAQNFFGLNAAVVNATLGFPMQLDGKDIESFRKQIPANVALGIEKCLAECEIERNYS